MKRFAPLATKVLALLLGLGVTTLTPLAASADTTPSTQPTITPDPDQDVFGLGAEQENPSSDSQVPGGSTTEPATPVVSTGNSLPPGEWVRSNACSTVGASGCIEEYECPDGSVPEVWVYQLQAGGVLGEYSQCPEDPPPTAETTPTQTVDIPAEVLNAFKRVALPQSTINVQPPGGETLVNLPTILSTSAERHQIPVHLGRVNIDVLLEVWPSRFVWHHGDDTSQETSDPGKAWTEGADLNDLITHTYAKTSEGLDLSVDTTWSAQFRVVGQPTWRPVDGTVTIDGAPVTVAVLEAKPQLVR
jgi:hypothetical protein